MTKYKGIILHRNSEAFALYVDKNYKKLDEHLAKLKQEAKKRGDYYEQAIHE